MKTPKEIAKLMFENGAKFVLVAPKKRKATDEAIECYLLARKHIDKYGLDEGFADVIDVTGKTIIDFVDGKEITE